MRVPGEAALGRAEAGFSALARHFARAMAEFDPSGGRELALAAALVSREVDAGHVCADLVALAGTPVVEGDPAGACFPEYDPWVRALRASAVVGAPGAFRPLVLDDAGRLYLWRYWAYERDVAAALSARVKAPAEGVDRAALAAALGRLFPQSAPGETDWQRVAALAAATRRFCVISGGPGTGKTHTAVNVIALLVELAGAHPPRVALAAPTGKAAARLKEALRRARARLPCAEAVRERIPEDVSTLHRLLGATGSAAGFRHGPGNPLPYDVVVIDEASMVDLPLMAKLVRALPATARLILLGDRDQLASVEAGAVLGDICAGKGAGSYSEGFAALAREAAGDAVPVGEGGGALGDAIVVLQRSYRFGAASGIGAVSRAVNGGDAEQAAAAIRGGAFADVGWRETPAPGRFERELLGRVLPHARGLMEAGSAAEALERLGALQVLCALRRGAYGAEEVNARLEGAVARAGPVQRAGRWYRGRPVMVTQNEYPMRLFNGDIGIALPDPEAGGELRVFFPAADGAVRSVVPSRLPAHETAYALTVHKAQGSEFDEVLLVLGAQPSRVLTRELVYTGLTRARSRVEVWGADGAFREAVSRRIRRSSGLRDALWRA